MRDKAIRRIGLLALLLHFLVACGGAEERREKHLQKAGFLYENGRYELAVEEFKNAAYIKPSDKAVHHQLAQSYEKLNDADSAIASYRRILELDPADQQPRIRLARIYVNTGELNRAAEQADALLHKDGENADALVIRSLVRSRQGRILAALKDARDALKSDRSLLAARIQLASLYLYQQRNKLAVQTLRKGLEQHPGNAGMLVQLARVYFLRGERLKAEKFLQSALQSDPDNAHYRALLAGISTDSTQAATAVETSKSWLTIDDEFFPNQFRLEKILEKTPSAIGPLSLLTRMLIRRGDYAQAEFFIQKALIREAGNTIARNFLAEVLIEQKQRSKAIVHLDQAIRTQPDWWLPYRNKALALIQEGNMPRALQTYREGIKSARITKVLRLDLALLYEQSGQTAEAVAVYERMLREDQQALEAANNLAMLLANDAERPEGLPKAQQLIRILQGEDNPAYLDTIGWVQLKSGQTDAAIVALSRAVEHAPEIGTIRYHLGKAYLQQGDLANARKQLREAIRLNESFNEREEALTIIGDMRLPAPEPLSETPAD